MRWMMKGFSFAKAFLPLLGGLLLAGCGYRAPLYKSYIPVVKDSTMYPGVRPGYKQLAALAEKDTGLKPSIGNTVTVIKDGKENLDMLKEDLRNARISAYIEPYRFRLDTTGVALKDILQEKAEEGVDIRLILDKSANIKKDRAELRKLKDFGAHVYIPTTGPRSGWTAIFPGWPRTGTTGSSPSWTAASPTWAAAVSRTSISLTGMMLTSVLPAPSLLI